MRKLFAATAALAVAALLVATPARAAEKDIVDTAIAAGNFKTLAKLLTDSDSMVRYAAAAKSARRAVKAHLKVDTGLGRLGFLPGEATAILNALYRGEAVPDETRARLATLFRLTFDDAADARAEVAGRPVYLGLAFREDHTLKMKPQNLLVNLPYARRS